MFTTKGKTLVARWLAALLCLAGAAAAGAAERAPAGAKQAQTPAALYHNYCSVCHGDNGDGQSRAKGSFKPAPRDFTTPQAVQELTRERMIAAVRNGVPGTAMVGWHSQLSEKQLTGVVDYIRTTFMRPNTTSADATRGQKIYARICSVCHGDRGSGSMWASANLRPTPRDFTSQAAKDELTRDRMLASVTTGRENTAMQGYGNRLSREDREAVVDYIRSAIMRVGSDTGISGTHAHGTPPKPAAKGKKGKQDEHEGHEHHDHGAHEKGSAADHAAHGHGTGAVGADGKVDMKLPFAGGLKGNVAQGKKFYEANCATCHGAKGDGQGPRAYFINPKPAVFTSDKSRAALNRPTLFDSVSTGRRGTEMPAWNKVMSPQELADVSEYVFRTFIQNGGGHVAKKP
jgi:mono/diheme cytochrome c family protein